ncbi:hypothetical protein DBA29_17220 [Xenophilus aerolatus]|nr:hypothetical protein [Xenophilus aerolatus]
MKAALQLCTVGAARPISRSAAAGMLRAARMLQQRGQGVTVAYSRLAGIVRGESRHGDWQIEHVRGAA